MEELKPNVANALKLITEAADKGERCPVNKNIPSAGTVIPELVRMGLIRIEVYQWNWRVVEIVKTGNKTKSSPYNGKPYKIIDHEGRQTKSISNKERRNNALSLNR